MSITRIDSSQRMSQVVIHGETIYLAGQVAQKAPGSDVGEQTSAILEQIEVLLQKAGSNKNKILSATIWLTSMDDFQKMNAIWDAWVPNGEAPCRACVESPKLASSSFNVEIAIIAAT